MKKLLGIALFATAIAGCGKTIDYTQPQSSAAMFINASPSGPIFNVLVDDINQTGTSLVYGASTAYLNLKPGARNIFVRSNNPALPTNYVSLPNENFAQNTASTYIVYDTLANAASQLKYIRLRDTLVTPPDGFMRIRYVNVARNSVPLDVTFVRTTVTPNDSITITNQTFVGSTPSEATIAAASRYLLVPAGNYTIRQKVAGTQTVLTSNSLSTTVGGIFKGFFTFYGRGTAAGQPLTIGAVRQYP